MHLFSDYDFSRRFLSLRPAIFISAHSFRLTKPLPRFRVIFFPEDSFFRKLFSIKRKPIESTFSLKTC